RPCAGEPAVTNHQSVLQTGTTRSREVAAPVGVTSEEAENAPRLRVANGEDSQESAPPLQRRVETQTAITQDSSTQILWRWRCNEPCSYPERYLDRGTSGSLLMAFPGTGNKGVPSTCALYRTRASADPRAPPETRRAS